MASVAIRPGRASARGQRVRRYLRLFGYLTPYWRGWLLIGVVTVLSTAVSLLYPWPLKIVVDYVVGDQPAPEVLAGVRAILPAAQSPAGLLLWVVVAGLGIFALDSIANVILTFSWVRVGQRMVYDLANDVFAHVQRRSLLFHARNEVGDSISRITGDSWCVHGVLDDLLVTPGHALIVIVGTVLVMASMDVELTVLSLVVAPFMAGSSFLFAGSIGAAARLRREVESHIQSHIQQTLSGIAVVQGFTQEERHRGRFKEFASAAIRLQQRSTLMHGLYDLGTGFAATLGTALILWVSAQHVLAGRLTLGSVLVFLAYLPELQDRLKSLTGIGTALQETRVSMDRVMDVLEAEREVTDRPGAPALPRLRGAVTLERVSFGYEPARPVLREVSLEVRPGETLAIVGPTGAGKSTLVSLVPRFIDPWRGRVLVDGRDVREVQVKSLREQVALVLQESFLFPLSLAENIAYGRPGATRGQIEAAARVANAHDFITQLPEGYDTVVGERGATLSGGERQRIAIARALLKDAPILILDEPTSALDAETEGQLMEALTRLMAGRTTLLVAHRLSTIRRAGRIVVLQAGRVIEVGSPAELLARDGLYAQLYRRQFGGERDAARAGA